MDFTLVHCTNWLSQDHLAPIGLLKQQGQWANRSSNLSQSLRAVRKICRGLDLAITTNHYSETPRKEPQKDQQGPKKVFWIISTPTPTGPYSWSHANKVSVFHWGAALFLLWSAAQSFLKQILYVFYVTVYVYLSWGWIKSQKTFGLIHWHCHWRLWIDIGCVSNGI